MKDRLNDFRRKLADLIEEYSVEITAKDEWTGYPECGEDIQIEFHITGEVINREYHPDASEKFGTYIDVQKLRTNTEKP